MIELRRTDIHISLGAIIEQFGLNVLEPSEFLRLIGNLP